MAASVKRNYSPFSKFPDSSLALFLKRNQPRKYQVSKSFFIREKLFTEKLFYKSFFK